mmetsp:Transcript_49296/g.107344  ORF Transcript_49296/g.107344 Transcript_49296/m.107344 type:complete len:223 (-) Transcript_49296:729-1397(-)
MILHAIRSIGVEDKARTHLNNLATLEICISKHTTPMQLGLSKLHRARDGSHLAWPTRCHKCLSKGIWLLLPAPVWREALEIDGFTLFRAKVPLVLQYQFFIGLNSSRGIDVHVIPDGDEFAVEIRDGRPIDLNVGQLNGLLIEHAIAQGHIGLDLSSLAGVGSILIRRSFHHIHPELKACDACLQVHLHQRANLHQLIGFEGSRRKDTPVPTTALFRGLFPA